MRATIKILTAITLTSVPAFANEPADPHRPTGTIDVENSYVRSGERAHISWNINYPIGIPDLVVPEPGGRVTTREELRVKMRVAGVAFQSGSTLLPVQFKTKLGSGPWQQLFNGTANAVQPDQYVFDQVVPAGTTIDFGAQGQNSSGDWYDPRWTSGTDITVTGLLNGDTPPSYAPAYEQGNIESFLSGYLSPENTIQIGPRDMIYLFELASRDPGDWWFDMQDIVVIVSYEQTTTTTSSGNPLVSQTNGGRRNQWAPRGGWRRGPNAPRNHGWHPATEPLPGEEVRD